MIVSTAFRVAAMLAAVASVLAFGGCETAPQRPPPSVNITGDWVGTWVFEPAAANVGGGQVAMTLRQRDDAWATGDLRITGETVNRPPTAIEGVVTGNEFRISGPNAYGTLTVSGNEMSGLIQGILPARVTLRRR